MTEYHKIDSVFLRNPETNNKTFIFGIWSRPEFGYLQDLEWVWTEKVDGTNVRVIWKKGEKPQFNGKTGSSQLPSVLFNQLNEKFTDELMTSCFPDVEEQVVLYSEGYGKGIQKAGSHYNPKGVGIILFDVTVGGIFLERPNIEDVGQKLGIPVVPIVGRGPLRLAIMKVMDGFKSSLCDHPAEGLVMRPTYEMFDRLGRRIITKVKSKDFRK